MLDIGRFYIEEKAERHGVRFLESAQRTFRQLCRNPLIGSKKVLRNPALRGLRRWQVDGFVKVQIYYLHEGKTIRVLRLLHGKRDTRVILELHT